MVSQYSYSIYGGKRKERRGRSLNCYLVLVVCNRSVFRNRSIGAVDSTGASVIIPIITFANRVPLLYCTIIIDAC